MKNKALDKIEMQACLHSSKLSKPFEPYGLKSILFSLNRLEAFFAFTAIARLIAHDFLQSASGIRCGPSMLHSH